MKKLKVILKKAILKIQLHTNNIIFIYRKNTRNIGDLNSCPKSYFNIFKNCFSMDIMDLTSINLKNKIIIVGGGGLFQAFFQEKLKLLEELSENNTIVYWGVGIDNTAKEKPINTSFLEKAVLVGLRDKNTKYDFVPCVSCMSELFVKYANAETAYDIAFYLHRDYSENYIEYAKKYPLLTNKDNKSFEEIIKFLSKAKTIITNSYHGAYWSCLLNKNVVVVPWTDKFGNVWLSKKFEQFPFQYNYCEDLGKIKDFINIKTNNTETLTFARNQNKMFLNKISIKIKEQQKNKT